MHGIEPGQGVVEAQRKQRPELFHARTLRCFVIVLVTTCLAGCIFNSRHESNGLDDAGSASTDASPLRLRQLQIRDYDTPDSDLVIRAVIASLQDAGFTITSADAGLGLISAKLDAPTETGGSRRKQRRYWFAATGDSGEGGRRLEASISVLGTNTGSRVRLGFVKRVVAENGGISAFTVEDPDIYRNMFSRLDRAVFYELQRL